MVSAGLVPRWRGDTGLNKRKTARTRWVRLIMVGMFSKAADFGVDHPAATLACSAFAAGFSFMAYYHFSGPSIRSDEGTKTRNFFSLSKGLGGLKRKEVTNEWKDYDKTFTQSEGRGISDKDHTKDAVNTFYNLVTDIYEWGWGQSFHFSPSLKGKGVAPAEVAHETRVAHILGLKPGLKALDVGCGFGGPLRTITAHSGAHVRRHHQRVPGAEVRDDVREAGDRERGHTARKLSEAGAPV